MSLDPAVAWVAVLLMALLMVLQSVIVFVLFWGAGKQLRASQPAISSFLARIESGVGSLRQLLSHVEGVPAKVAEVSRETPELLTSLTDIFREIDQSLGKFLERSRSHLYAFDSAADTVLSNFSTQTFRVHRAVIHPAIRFSTLLQSVNGLASRFLNDEEPPASHSPDQEIFI